MVGMTMSSMSRVIAAVACGLAVADCSMSLPGMDFFKSTPPTDVLRIESEPPGADARTSQGQTCRTPCELTVSTEGELAVTVQMTGYQPQTLPVSAGVKGGEGHVQPNPLYVELQPVAPPPKPAKPAPKKKTTANPPAAARAPAAPPAQTQASAPPPRNTVSPFPSMGGNPWPPAPQ
jgi:hypothetical protein